MASLMCNNCGYGIHYHDEPNGTEHIAIPVNTWKYYLSANESIIRCYLDGPQNYYVIWKCAKCGCLHTFFADSIHVTKAYAPTEYNDAIRIINGVQCRVFDDYLFEAVSEVNLTAKEYEQSKEYRPCYFAIIGDNYIVLYDDAEFTRVTGCFQAIEGGKMISTGSSDS